MTNPNELPSEEEIMQTINDFDLLGQVEAIPNDFMVKAVVVWIQKYYDTELKARERVEEIMEHYDNSGQVWAMILEMNYRQILVEIARRQILSNEDILATIIA